MSELRCIHRHGPDTHPNCFRKGLVRRSDWWRNSRIGYLDIETSDLKADFGIMLSWCIKPRGVNKVFRDVITRDQIFNYEFDRAITQSLIDEMNNYDILVTYYGTGFDIPYIKTKGLYWDIPFPPFGTVYHWDLYYYCKRIFKTSRKSLDRITNYLGIKGKTHVDPEHWFKGAYGDKTALKYILDHNVEDVKILEQLHDRVWEYGKWKKTSL